MMTGMRRFLLVIAAVVLTLSAAGRSTTKLPNLFNQVDQVAMNQWVDSVFNSLSADGRIGQLIVAAVTPRSNDATREAVRRLVSQNLVGGLIYEGSTIAEQAEVTNLASFWEHWTTTCCCMSTAAKWLANAAAWASRSISLPFST